MLHCLCVGFESYITSKLIFKPDMVIEIMGKAPLQTNFRNKYVLVKMLYNIKDVPSSPFILVPKPRNTFPKNFRKNIRFSRIFNY